MVLFIAGNLLSALAADYATMMTGRIVAALCHGAFFGIGAVVAAGLVAPARRAGAIAMMFAGLTTANVLGVPFGTLLGQQLRLARHLLGDHRHRRGRADRAGPAGPVAGRPPTPTPAGGLRGELRAFTPPPGVALAG